MLSILPPIARVYVRQVRYFLNVCKHSTHTLFYRTLRSTTLNERCKTIQTTVLSSYSAIS